MPKTTDDKPIPITERTETMFKLMDTGMPIETAYAVVHPNKKLGKHNKDSMMQKHKRWSLTNPKLVKAAYQALQDTVSMLPVQCGDATVIPTISNRLTAAQMIVDRAEPIINKNLNINANLDVSPVDLDKYRM